MEMKEQLKVLEEKYHAKTFRTVFIIAAGLWLGMIIFDICLGRYTRIWDHVTITSLCVLATINYDKIAKRAQDINDLLRQLDEKNKEDEQ